MLVTTALPERLTMIQFDNCGATRPEFRIKLLYYDHIRMNISSNISGLTSRNGVRRLKRRPTFQFSKIRWFHRQRAKEKFAAKRIIDRL
jgi:hypothetical protein